MSMRLTLNAGQEFKNVFTEVLANRSDYTSGGFNQFFGIKEIEQVTHGNILEIGCS